MDNLIREHLENYSDQCVAIFVRYISIYEDKTNGFNTRIECIGEVFDDFSISLTFLRVPGMGNYGQVLNDEDQDFMNKPVFLDESKENEFLEIIESYLVNNNIDKDAYDEYQGMTLDLVPEWLSECWVKANNAKGTSYNLYYFFHRYFNEPAVNLLNKEKVFLEELNK